SGSSRNPLIPGRCILRKTRHRGKHRALGSGSCCMNDETPPVTSSPDREAPPSPPARANQTLGASSIYRLCEEIIALPETNNRQHKLFEQALAKTRDGLQTTFNSFAADTQRAYQQLRQEIHGEKRVSVALLNELMEVGYDLERIVAARPKPDDAE